MKLVLEVLDEYTVSYCRLNQWN